VDSNSTDNTKEIAHSLGAKVVNFTWDGKYPKKKQWQLDNLKFRNEWVLLLDADESPTRELIRELGLFFENTRHEHYVAVQLPLDYVFMGRTLKFGHRVKKTTLLRQGYCEFPEIQDLDIPGMVSWRGIINRLYGALPTGQSHDCFTRILTRYLLGLIGTIGTRIGKQHSWLGRRQNLSIATSRAKGNYLLYSR